MQLLEAAAGVIPAPQKLWSTTPLARLPHSTTGAQVLPRMLFATAVSLPALFAPMRRIAFPTLLVK